MTKRRQQLRRQAPPAEAILWQHLKHRRLAGCKFRRQYSIGRYVVDFYCPEKRLVIEVDGPSHFMSDAVREYDTQRQEYIESHGMTVFRCTNYDVYQNIHGVIDTISGIVGEPT